MLSEKKLNLFVVGTKFGSTYMEAARNNPHWELIGCAARTEKSVANAGKKFKIPENHLFTDLEKALDELSDIDAVVIATPNRFHYDQSQMVLKHNLNLILEKPIVETWEEAVSLVKSLDKSGKKGCVGQTMRGEPKLRYLAKMLNEGIIGDISQLNFQSHWFWKPNDNWRFSLKNMFLDDIGIHQIDTIRMLLNNRKAIRVFADAYNSGFYPLKEMNTSCSALILMEDDIRVNFFGSMGLKGQEMGWYGEIKIFGSKGSIYKNPYEDPLIFPEKKLLKGKKKLSLPKDLKKVLSYSEYIKIPYILEDFYHAIVEDRPPITDLHDNLNSFAILLGIKKSAEQNRVVNIQEEFKLD
ncbi:MAG: Gfo/Idh/MocA family protein [Promethearchaeota archaeon]